MVKVEYQYMTDKQELIKVEYYLTIKNRADWKEIAKKDFSNILDSHDDDLMYIRFGV